MNLSVPLHKNLLITFAQKRMIQSLFQISKLVDLSVFDKGVAHELEDEVVNTFREVLVLLLETEAHVVRVEIRRHSEVHVHRGFEAGFKSTVS